MSGLTAEQEEAIRTYDPEEDPVVRWCFRIGNALMLLALAVSAWMFYACSCGSAYCPR